MLNERGLPSDRTVQIGRPRWVICTRPGRDLDVAPQPGVEIEEGDGNLAPLGRLLVFSLFFPLGRLLVFSLFFSSNLAGWVGMPGRSPYFSCHVATRTRYKDSQVRDNW